MRRRPRLITSVVLIVVAAVLEQAGRGARSAAARLVARATCYAAGRDPDAPLRKPYHAP
jgi:hypothetical protein